MDLIFRDYYKGKWCRFMCLSPLYVPPFTDDDEDEDGDGDGDDYYYSYYDDELLASDDGVVNMLVGFFF